MDEMREYAKPVYHVTQFIGRVAYANGYHGFLCTVGTNIGPTIYTYEFTHFLIG